MATCAGAICWPIPLTNNLHTRWIDAHAIALPGMAALQATLHRRRPTRYIRSARDGSSQFSSSLTAHNRAVNQYTNEQNS